ncbi:hypothetical protein M0G43_05840 [Subsaxibacter sp. CAU 1640]|uniref:hypothetical protein n=1 Tax=Subsaxibacter sp. CAU 1640 TaxID=2933271 RepID=UPI00200371FE|nr:hypothetical protein [Subsaxibacter sp. CAU 1640]MCK7590085.1 hypothetical protein [Subsaxibacter sp. CAU 1640]
MDNSNNIIDSSLEVAHSTLDNFDSTLGKIPIYKAGHNLGGFISGLIDKMVDMVPNNDSQHSSKNKKEHL